jgi:hypothetical protein
MEPGDPRAKAIEAMARQAFDDGVRGSNGPWDAQHEDIRRSWLNAAERSLCVALAALEQEGLVLTDTREAETVATLRGLLGTLRAINRDAIDREFEAKREVQRLREALQEIGRLSSYDGVKRARIIAHEALSSVPVRGGGEHRCLTPATTTTSPVAAGSAPSGSAYAAASGRERLAS